MSRLLLLLLAGVLPFLVVGPIQAQPARTADTFYLRFGQGASDLSGGSGAGTGISDIVDSEKFNDDDLQHAFTSEVGYRFSSASSLGVGYQLGTYYHSADGGGGAGSETLHTVQLLARHKPGARSWRAVPYFDLGINVSSGIQQFGFGPTVGVGVSAAVDNQMSIFLESRFNFVFPSQTAETDGLFGPRSIRSTVLAEDIPFDVLTVLPAIGVEFELR